MSSDPDQFLDIRALQAFLAAMSTGSMTGAAQLLGKSQPAVTRVVRELEEAVGFQLFHRNGPRISPTERGLLFHEEAVRLMAGMRQISSRATAIRDNIAASLDIAATPTMSGGLIAPALAGLGEAQPDFINVQTMGAEHVVRSVHARTADIGVSSFPLDYAGLSIQAICERDCVGVVADDDPLARQSVLSLASLTERRLVTVGNAFRLRRSIDRAISQAGIHPPRDFSTNTSLNAVMAARAGLGVAIIDPVTAFGIPVQGVKVLPLDVRIPYFWGLFSDAARVVSPLTSAFVDAFIGSCSAIIPDCRFHDPADQPDMSPDRDH
ncbi:LysR family transcriptional regulator [Pelagibacterium halotolerans]|uniref:Transcriptional regulator, LysR family n=1 Tax=Pelagibacterium halotolerans (strain DSM 22347 / JCM 15775 / CGMCC 1.7692 / B2) TaxID=1082931 RepID=G4REM8_PELHB|nr:LysR family transcriptional regulator [Pelagibacterium halotolerans]AEQ50878.1 transcriptional regulator, LysR family [Pelagibacterium halotolerans B2]QJR19214.1 LysR family transcriptional regulator [Pelagibacterium halotolerans]SDZ98767.1 DNA-binding transcriptional regulator, LysR family [Pelagibacterium halotolerans]